tara:strand:+ start:1180 stop:1809 length:630 start_codon:yes stop_codon:yes gene_type:complete
MGESNEQRRARQYREFIAEQDRVCDILGWKSLAALCPVPLESVRRALADGDWHLNSIPLKLWDDVALGYDPKAPRRIPCCTCGQSRPNPEAAPSPGMGSAGVTALDRIGQTMRREPWTWLRESQSVSTRVCALKHAARRAAEEWAAQQVRGPVPDATLLALRDEAGAAWDPETVGLCERALGDREDHTAHAALWRVLDDARAMLEDGEG